MTLLLYARRKGWPVESVTVELSHERAGGREAADVVRIYTLLKGRLTQEQRERLKAIASRCPVHRTLSHPPRIVEEMDVVP